MLDTLNFSRPQQDWLEQNLYRLNELSVDHPSIAPQYVLVVGNYPVLSDGPGGDIMSATVLSELFETYGITAYISGFDANLQHLKVR